MTALQRLIQAQRAKIDAALTQRATHVAAIDQIRSAAFGADGTVATLTEEQTAGATAARAQIDQIDAQVTELRSVLEGFEAEQRANEAAETLARSSAPTDRAVGGARIGQEARTYSRETARQGISFFQDAFRAQHGRDHAADERLQRHAQEMFVDLRESGQWFREAGPDQARALTTGTVGGLMIPVYLTELATTVLRNGSPLVNLLPTLPLPAEGMSLTIPRASTGATAASQVTENTQVSQTDPTWTTDLVIPVNTIAGEVDLSRQLLDRGTGYDQLVYNDLAAAYAAEKGRQVLNGSGTANQALGMLQTAGRITATAFGAAATIANFHKKEAGVIAGITASADAINPDLIAMHPRRWGWMTGETDSTGRPLVVPLPNGPYNATALNLAPGQTGSSAPGPKSATIVGSFQGMPVTTDTNIPTNVGTNNEDVVVTIDTAKQLLWEEGDGSPRFLRFDQVNTLTVKLVAYGYMAFSARRYPTSIGQVGGLDTGAGNGLVAPTF